MRRALVRFTLLALLFCINSGCGTLFNVTGQEPWLMGPPPQRPIAVFGGIDNDLRWMARGIRPDGCESGPIVVAAIDMPLSLAGDVVTLPWTAFQSLRRFVAGDDVSLPPPPWSAYQSVLRYAALQNAMKMELHFDNEAMRREVMKHLSIGMPIHNAKEIMQAGGFECEKSFWKQRPGVHCSAVYRTHDLFVRDEIHIYLHEQSGKLSGVDVACRSIAP
jgi:uncharacterized protein YceK